MGEPTYQNGSHAMNGGSGGEAVGSMGDANDEMWEKFLALLFLIWTKTAVQSCLKAQAQR